MSKDSKGNALTEVDIPIDGQIWIGPSTVEVLEKTALMADVLEIPEELEPLGLLTKDGGPQWSVNGAADATEFYQEGYKYPGMGGSYRLAVKAAQNQPLVAELLNGVAFDADGYRLVDQITNPKVYTVLSQIIYKSGRIERRMSDNVTVAADSARDKSERPNPEATSLVFDYAPMANHAYFAEAKFMAKALPE